MKCRAETERRAAMKRRAETVPSSTASVIEARRKLREARGLEMEAETQRLSPVYTEQL